MTYKEIVTNFKPVFGNANHITAVPLIDRIGKLQASLDKYNAKRTGDGKPVKAPKKLITELDQLEKRVVILLSAGAPHQPYKGSDHDHAAH